MRLGHTDREAQSRGPDTCCRGGARAKFCSADLETLLGLEHMRSGLEPRVPECVGSWLSELCCLVLCPQGPSVWASVSPILSLRV